MTPSPAEAAPSFLFAPAIGSEDSEIELSAEESHYLLRVCRARVDDSVRATDGRGTVATLRVVGVRGKVRARIEGRERVERRGESWMLCGAPEGDRADWLVEKLAELGVARWQPVDCERAVWRRTSGRLARWNRLAIAGLRQSRRAHLLEVAEPLPLGRALEGLPPGAFRWAADAAGRPPGSASGTAAASWAGAVGPSEGLTPEESRELAGAGFEPIRLSEARLRTETAAILLAGLWGAREEMFAPGA